ncbi:secretin N-terminal domain-containing protein, partial [Spirochaetota bacterium]
MNLSMVKNAHAKKKKRKRRWPRKFALNFKDVEISEFISVMSQLIKKNIILSDKVKGKITINSAKKVPISQAYEIMKSILEIKGYAVVEAGHLIKVVPIKEAMKKNVQVMIDGKAVILKTKKVKTITSLYEIKNADANEISKALKNLKSKETDIIVYQPLNMVIFSGRSTEIDGLINIVKALDKSTDEEKVIEKGNIHIYHLENADAVELANVLSRVPFSEYAKVNTSPILRKKSVRKSRRSSRITRQQRSRKKTGKLSIIANKETNSLIIVAKPREFKEIKRVIRQLDIVREQVLIEALIIEVTAENGWGFGIDWMLGNKSGTHLYGGSSIMGNPGITSIGQTIAGKTLPLPIATGLQLGYISDTSLLGFALLNATGTDSNFNILSTPQILTIDNHEAELKVGENIPVPTNNRISEAGTQFFTFDYKSVGVNLKITPHITKNKRITLDLYQEVNSVLGQTTVLDGGSVVPPILGERIIKTKVTVYDGKTIVVGGLIRNNKIVQETKVPVLGDIPILGWFFKHKTVEYKKTNLLVFITPHIVTKLKKLESITQQKKNIQRRLRGR